MVIGCLKARSVSVNIKSLLLATRGWDLFSCVQPRAVIYRRSVGVRSAEVITAGRAGLVSIDDRSDWGTGRGDVQFRATEHSSESGSADV